MNEDWLSFSQKGEFHSFWRAGSILGIKNNEKMAFFTFFDHSNRNPLITEYHEKVTKYFKQIIITINTNKWINANINKQINANINKWINANINK